MSLTYLYGIIFLLLEGPAVIMPTPLRFACWGSNGHQVSEALRSNPIAQLVAVGAMPAPDWAPDLPVFDCLEALLKHGTADIISLCSPRRADQATDAMRCLAAGRHVLAEKPCALNECDLDRLITAARTHRVVFHEMAGTAFVHPWRALTRLIREERLGTILQISAQKSYPMHNLRPQDEDIDGGLLCQVGIHALRFIEHACGIRIAGIEAWESRHGNPIPGGNLRTSAAMLVHSKQGVIANIAINYGNPPGFGSWGDDQLRIWGTLGMAEITRGARHSRVVIGEQDHGPLIKSDSDIDWLQAMCTEIQDGSPFPISLEDELSPTRWIIRAKSTAKIIS
jgi:predicted dehydrogenase